LILYHIFTSQKDDLKINFNDDGIDFSAIGLGAQGKNNYHFEIDFYIKIDPEVSTVQPRYMVESIICSYHLGLYV
jgi:hypothetical protein